MDKQQKWILRKPIPSDINFISDTWLKTYRFKSKWASRIIEGCFYAEHGKMVQRAFRHSVTIVACDPIEPSHIFGYLVGMNRPKADVLHYIYVKKPFRSSGVAADMVDSFQGQDYLFNTHETIPYHFLEFLRNRYHKVTYNPYLFINEEVFQ